MGIYINKGNENFKGVINGEYVDKTGMIEVINKTLNTERRFTCVTRCRRFGKSIALKMLCAYYDKSCDSRSLFEKFEIKKCPSFEEHLNKYPVISLDLTSIITRYRADKDIVNRMQQDIKEDVLAAYPDVKTKESDDLMAALLTIANQTGERFIFLIDEWDAILREFAHDSEVTLQYVDLLRRLFKGDDSSRVFAGAYMTGILPIKKYNTQSALNNFREYSVIQPGKLDKYFGFTPEEVKMLAAKSDVSVEDLKAWYDGYSIGNEPSMYNPYSVIEAIANEACGNFWSKTAAYDSVSTYIEMNYDGLKDDIIKMLAGGRCFVNTVGFSNDLYDIRSKDDVLTVLIHLGYLAYDNVEEECFIPNKEVRTEMANAIKNCKWHVAEALEKSKQLLKDTLDGNVEAVARGIELAHDANTSILSYNDENSLACVLTVAYYHAMNDYIIHRELATGKGFADLVFIPRHNVNKPAMVLELKFDKDADTAIAQIKHKEYPTKVAEYIESSSTTEGTWECILVGINYDPKGPEGKRHTCVIERYSK